MEMAKCFLAGILLLSSGVHTAENFWYDAFIPATYNPLRSPAFGGSVQVGIVVWILSFHDFDIDSAQLSADLYLGQYWNEPRLTSDKTRVAGQLILPHGEKYLWIPDTFIPEAVQSKKSDGPNSLVRIDPDGTVFYSQKLQVRILCDISYVKFPFDEVCCTMPFESFSMNTSRLHYYWREVGGNLTKAEDVRPDMRLIRTEQAAHNVYMAADEYSRLELILFLRRSPTYYVHSLMLPLGAFVALTYCTFFMSIKSPTPRLLLNSAMLLSALYVTMEMKNHLPHTPSWTGMDTWTAASFIFMMTAMAETILVICGNEPDMSEEKPGKVKSFIQKNAGRADRVFRIGYPISYALFIIIYCGAYLG